MFNYVNILNELGGKKVFLEKEQALQKTRLGVVKAS